MVEARIGARDSVPVCVISHAEGTITITHPGQDAHSWRKLITGAAAQMKEAQAQPESKTYKDEL